MSYIHVCAKYFRFEFWIGCHMRRQAPANGKGPWCGVRTKGQVRGVLRQGWRYQKAGTSDPLNWVSMKLFTSGDW
jgi:hypothetical protein